MSTNVTWNGTTYSIPASGETGWSALSSFLLALGNGAAVAEEMKQAIRVATTSPVTVSDTTDCVVAVNRSVAGATTVNLPAGTDGRWFVICDQKADAATNNITVTPNGAETINGSATYVMNQNNEAIVIAYSLTNTRWNVVARFTSGAPLSNPMSTTGDMIYGGASGVPTKVATGATTGLLHGGNGAVPSWSLVTNADIVAAAGIVDSKLAQITTAGKVDGGAITSGTIGGTTAITTTGAASISATCTLGASGASNVTHIVQNGSTSQTYSAVIRNNDTTTSSDGQYCLGIRKGSTTNTAGVNRFIIFEINASGTNSGYIASNGANAAAFFATSDRRLKSDVKEMTGALDKITSLRPVTFRWKEDKSESRGFIAQELAKVMPQAVCKTDSGEGDTVPKGSQPWTMTESGFIPYLVAAIKELKAEFDAYKAAHP